MNTISRRDILVVAGGAIVLSRKSYGASPSGTEAAPFGLSWGMTIQEVKQLGATLIDVKQGDYGAECHASNLPKALSDLNAVGLFFGFRDSMWRIVALGRPMGPDPIGGEVVSRYQDLAKSLSARYGNGIETDSRDTEIWTGPTEYVMSLKQGRAWRYTEFSTQNVSVELSLRASDGDTAFYAIIFEYLPGKSLFANDKASREKGAL